mgnify:CR=1 FL=1
MWTPNGARLGQLPAPIGAANGCEITVDGSYAVSRAVGGFYLGLRYRFTDSGAKMAMMTMIQMIV